MHHTPQYTDSRRGNRFPIIPFAMIAAAAKNQKHDLAGMIVHLASIRPDNRPQSHEEKRSVPFKKEWYSPKSSCLVEI